MRRALVLLPLLLAGCSWFSGGSDKPEAETRPEYRACQREAENNPEVIALGAQSTPDWGLNQARIGPQRQVLINRAYRDCLRRRGLGLPGGVETLRTR
jgi:hypothetical protein